MKKCTLVKELSLDGRGKILLVRSDDPTATATELNQLSRLTSPVSVILESDSDDDNDDGGDNSSCLHHYRGNVKKKENSSKSSLFVLKESKLPSISYVSKNNQVYNARKNYHLETLNECSILVEMAARFCSNLTNTNSNKLDAEKARYFNRPEHYYCSPTEKWIQMFFPRWTWAVDLFDAVSNSQNNLISSTMNFPLIYEISRNLIDGLIVAHEELRLMLLDIKLENTLVNLKTGEIKFIDLGTSWLHPQMPLAITSASSGISSVNGEDKEEKKEESKEEKVETELKINLSLDNVLDPPGEVLQFISYPSVPRPLVSWKSTVQKLSQARWLWKKR